MNLENNEQLSLQDDLSSAEKQFFGMADVEALADDPNTESFTYPYNKTSVDGIKDVYVDVVLEGALNTKIIKDASDNNEKIPLENGVDVLSHIIISPRANMETVNMADLDLDQETRDAYERASEQYIDQSKMSDSRYRDNLTLAYARGQELIKYLNSIGFQGSIDLRKPQVIAKSDDISEEDYVKIPGLKVETTFIKFYSYSLAKRATELNGHPVIVFNDEETHLTVVGSDDLGRPNRLEFGNKIIDIHPEDYTAGEAGMPLVEFREKINGEEILVKNYIDFGANPSWLSSTDKENVTIGQERVDGGTRGNKNGK